MRNNYICFERIHEDEKKNINKDKLNNRTNYNFKTDFNNVINNHLIKNKDKNSISITNIDNCHKIYFNENYNNHNICITTNIKSEKNKDNSRKTLIYNNSVNNMSKSLNIPHNKNKEKKIFNNITNKNVVNQSNKKVENNINIFQKNNEPNLNNLQNLSSNIIITNKNNINNIEYNKNSSIFNNNSKNNLINDKIMNTINKNNNKHFKEITKNKSVNKPKFKPDKKKLIHKKNYPSKIFYNYNGCSNASLTIRNF